MSKKSFAVILGDKVAGTTSIDMLSPFGQRQIAALLSNPVVIETTNPEVGPGWIWNGIDFIKPGV